MDNARYPRQCYNVILTLDESNRITWARNVKNLLYRYGFGFVWISQDVGDENYFMFIFKQRLMDNALQE